MPKVPTFRFLIKKLLKIHLLKLVNFNQSNNIIYPKVCRTNCTLVKEVNYRSSEELSA